MLYDQALLRQRIVIIFKITLSPTLKNRIILEISELFVSIIELKVSLKNGFDGNKLLKLISKGIDIHSSTY